MKMRFITKSRFSNLWSKLLLLLSLQCLQLCNAVHFIDPYLEDIHSIRDFHPRRIYNQFLEPIESRLTRPISSMQMRPHDSNLVEVRVKPPEGFPNFPLTSSDSSSSSSTTVVRTVSSVSEKIRSVLHEKIRKKERKNKKPFIKNDIGSKEEQTGRKNYVIKTSKNTEKPVVFMKELPKPTKEALVHNVDKSKTTPIDEGIVISIEKKLAHSRNGTNVYRIKKKRKLPVQLPVVYRNLPKASPLVSSNNFIKNDSTKNTPKKTRPNFDPRFRIRTSPASSTTISTTTLSEKSRQSDKVKSTVSTDPLPVTRKILFMPTPVPLIQIKPAEEKLEIEERTVTFNKLPEITTSATTTTNRKSSSKNPFPVFQLDTEETTISFNKLRTTSSTSITTNENNQNNYDVTNSFPVQLPVSDRKRSTVSPLINDVYEEPTKMAPKFPTNFNVSKTTDFDITGESTTEKINKLIKNLKIRKLPTASALVVSNNYDYEEPTKMAQKFPTNFDISKTADFDITEERTTEKSGKLKNLNRKLPTASSLFGSKSYDYEESTKMAQKFPTNFDISKTADFDITGESTTEKWGKLKNLNRKLPTASSLVSSNNYVYEEPTEMTTKFRTSFDISKTTDFDIIDEITTKKSDKLMNFNDFEEYDESQTMHDHEPRSFEFLKVGVEKEEELENQNNNDKVDYKSRSLKIFPRLINRGQKKPPKFVAIPLNKPVSSKIPGPPPPGPPRPPPPPPPPPRSPPRSSKPQPTLVVKPIRPQVPSKVRLYYKNKRKRKVVKNVQEPGLRGYDKTIAALKTFESSSKKPFTSNPEFEDTPINYQQNTSPTLPITGDLKPFEETVTQEVRIPLFPEFPSWASNWNFDFGLKLTTPPTKKLVFDGTGASPKLQKKISFEPSSRIKVNPLGVLNNDNKWHPVSDISTTTTKPYILEGSAKTMGDFIGKSKSTTDDSLAKLLVNDPYESEEEGLLTDRVDQILPDHPVVPREIAQEYHRQPVFEPIYREDYQQSPKTNYQENHQYHTDHQPIYQDHQPIYQENHQPNYQENHQKFDHQPIIYQENHQKFDHQPIYKENHQKFDHQPIYKENHQSNYQENRQKFDQPSPYPYNTAFHNHGPAHNEPGRSGRILAIPAIKDNDFPDIVRHISTYGRSLSVSEDLVDFGAATGGLGSFGWYSDHPVGTLAINEGLFA